MVCLALSAGPKLHGRLEASACDASLTGLDRSAQRILLVDDNADAREAMGTLLQIHGRNVEFALDGHSALAAARALQPKFVILDIGLPDIDGYEVARRLRAIPGGCNARLIALTGYGQSGDLAAAAAAGFDAHILKPAQMDELLTKIAAFSLH